MGAAEGGARFVWPLFGCSGVDYGADPGDEIGGEVALLGMLVDGGLIGCDVDAIDFVFSDIAMEPCDLGTEVAENSAGGLRESLELLGREFAGAGDFAFYDEFWHGEKAPDEYRA